MRCAHSRPAATCGALLETRPRRRCAFGGIAKPYLSHAADRPVVSHGVQSGDVSASSGVVWARADRPARMLVEWSTTESFRTVQRVGYVDALPESDLTANMLLEHLPAGEHIFYRIRLADLASPTITSEPRGRPSAHCTRGPAIRSHSSGRVTPPGRAGGSTKRAAGCAPTPPCCATGLIFLSTAATTSMPTSRLRPSRRCPMASFGAIS